MPEKPATTSLNSNEGGFKAAESQNDEFGSGNLTINKVLKNNVATMPKPENLT